MSEPGRVCLQKPGYNKENSWTSLRTFMRLRGDRPVVGLVHDVLHMHIAHVACCVDQSDLHINVLAGSKEQNNRGMSLLISSFARKWHDLDCISILFVV